MPSLLVRLLKLTLKVESIGSGVSRVRVTVLPSGESTAELINQKTSDWNTW